MYGVRRIYPGVTRAGLKIAQVNAGGLSQVSKERKSVQLFLVFFLKIQELNLQRNMVLDRGVVVVQMLKVDLMRGMQRRMREGNFVN